MQVMLGTSKGQVVALSFGQRHLAASQTDIQLPVALADADQAVDGYVAPWSGRIVAVGASLSGAGSAGSLTIGATVNGTEDADTALTITTATNASKLVSRAAAKFAAGDRIGCEITTTAGWNGTSVDLSAQVYVVFDLDGI